MQLAKVKGVQQIIKNMGRARKSVAAGVSSGLVKGGRFLQRESQLLVPVNLGNLKNTAFTRKTSSGLTTHVVVGYTAGYATFVHEDLDKVHGKAFNTKYAAEIAGKGRTLTRGKNKGKTIWKAQDYYHPRGENQQAKFLEKPARQHRKRIMQIIANEILKRK